MSAPMMHFGNDTNALLNDAMNAIEKVNTEAVKWWDKWLEKEKKDLDVDEIKPLYNAIKLAKQQAAEATKKINNDKNNAQLKIVQATRAIEDARKMNDKAKKMLKIEEANKKMNQAEEKIKVAKANAQNLELNDWAKRILSLYEGTVAPVETAKNKVERANEQNVKNNATLNEAEKKLEDAQKKTDETKINEAIEEKNRAKEKLDQAKKKLDQAKEKMDQAKEEAKEKMEQAKEEAKEKMEQAKKEAKEKMEQAKKEAEENKEELDQAKKEANERKEGKVEVNVTGGTTGEGSTDSAAHRTSSSDNKHEDATDDSNIIGFTKLPIDAKIDFTGFDTSINPLDFASFEKENTVKSIFDPELIPYTFRSYGSKISKHTVDNLIPSMTAPFDRNVPIDMLKEVAKENIDKYALVLIQMRTLVKMFINTMKIDKRADAYLEYLRFCQISIDCYLVGDQEEGLFKFDKKYGHDQFAYLQSSEEYSLKKKMFYDIVKFLMDSFNQTGYLGPGLHVPYLGRNKEYLTAFLVSYFFTYKNSRWEKYNSYYENPYVFWLRRIGPKGSKSKTKNDPSTLIHEIENCLDRSIHRLFDNNGITFQKWRGIYTTNLGYNGEFNYRLLKKNQVHVYLQQGVFRFYLECFNNKYQTLYNSPSYTASVGYLHSLVLSLCDWLTTTILDLGGLVKRWVHLLKVFCYSFMTTGMFSSSTMYGFVSICVGALLMIMLIRFLWPALDAVELVVRLIGFFAASLIGGYVARQTNKYVVGPNKSMPFTSISGESSKGDRKNFLASWTNSAANSVAGVFSGMKDSLRKFGKNVGKYLPSGLGNKNDETVKIPLYDSSSYDEKDLSDLLDIEINEKYFDGALKGIDKISKLCLLVDPRLEEFTKSLINPKLKEYGAEDDHILLNIRLDIIKVLLKCENINKALLGYNTGVYILKKDNNEGKLGIIHTPGVDICSCENERKLYVEANNDEKNNKDDAFFMYFGYMYKNLYREVLRVCNDLKLSPILSLPVIDKECDNPQEPEVIFVREKALNILKDETFLKRVKEERMFIRDYIKRISETENTKEQFTQIQVGVLDHLKTSQSSIPVTSQSFLNFVKNNKELAAAAGATMLFQMTGSKSLLDKSSHHATAHEEKEEDVTDHRGTIEKILINKMSLAVRNGLSNEDFYTVDPKTADVLHPTKTYDEVQDEWNKSLLDASERFDALRPSQPSQVFHDDYNKSMPNATDSISSALQKVVSPMLYDSSTTTVSKEDTQRQLANILQGQSLSKKKDMFKMLDLLCFLMDHSGAGMDDDSDDDDEEGGEGDGKTASESVGFYHLPPSVQRSLSLVLDPVNGHKVVDDLIQNVKRSLPSGSSSHLDIFAQSWEQHYSLFRGGFEDSGRGSGSRSKWIGLSDLALVYLRAYTQISDDIGLYTGYRDSTERKGGKPVQYLSKSIILTPGDLLLNANYTEAQNSLVSRIHGLLKDDAHVTRDSVVSKLTIRERFILYDIFVAVDMFREFRDLVSSSSSAASSVISYLPEVIRKMLFSSSGTPVVTKKHLAYILTVFMREGTRTLWATWVSQHGFITYPRFVAYCCWTDADCRDYNPDAQAALGIGKSAPLISIEDIMHGAPTLALEIRRREHSVWNLDPANFGEVYNIKSSFLSNPLGSVEKMFRSLGLGRLYDMGSYAGLKDVKKYTGLLAPIIFLTVTICGYLYTVSVFKPKQFEAIQTVVTGNKSITDLPKETRKALKISEKDVEALTTENAAETLFGGGGDARNSRSVDDDALLLKGEDPGFVNKMLYYFQKAKKQMNLDSIISASDDASLVTSLTDLVTTLSQPVAGFAMGVFASESLQQMMSAMVGGGGFDPKSSNGADADTDTTGVLLSILVGAVVALYFSGAGRKALHYIRKTVTFSDRKIMENSQSNPASGAKMKSVWSVVVFISLMSIVVGSFLATKSGNGDQKQYLKNIRSSISAYTTEARNATFALTTNSIGLGLSAITPSFLASKERDPSIKKQAFKSAPSHPTQRDKQQQTKQYFNPVF